MQTDVTEEIVRAVPGAIGALVALRWLGGTPWQVAASLLGGAAGSYYGTPQIVSFMGTTPGLTGFLLGLFGMAVVARVFDAIQVMEIGRVVNALLRKWGML